MRFLCAAFFTTVIASAASAGENKTHNPAWYACKQNDDCMIATASCERIAAVNKSTHKEYEEYINELSSVIFCMEPKPIQNKKDVRAVCINQLCKLQPEPIYGVVE